MARSTKALCLALALFAFAAAVWAQDTTVRPQRAAGGACQFDTVKAAVDFALRNREELSTFRRAVAAADLGTTANPREAKFTIFAPTDGAMEEIADGVGVGTADNLINNPANRDLLNRVVRTHFTNSGAFPARALRNNQVLQTLQPDTTLTINTEKDTEGRRITVVGPRNRAEVGEPRNIRACKSIIHTLDEPGLLPRTDN